MSVLTRIAVYNNYWVCNTALNCSDNL